MKPLAAVLMAIVFAAGIAAAQPAQETRGPLFQRLNLTQEQRDQMQKLRSDFQKKQVQTQAKIRTAEIDLRDMLRSDNPDRKAIESKVKDISSFREQAQMDRIEQMFAVRALLTPEQRRMWNDRMMEGMNGMMGRHPHAPRGPGMGSGPMDAPPAPEQGNAE